MFMICSVFTDMKTHLDIKLSYDNSCNISLCIIKCCSKKSGIVDTV